MCDAAWKKYKRTLLGMEYLFSAPDLQSAAYNIQILVLTTVDMPWSAAGRMRFDHRESATGRALGSLHAGIEPCGAFAGTQNVGLWWFACGIPIGIGDIVSLPNGGT